MAELTMDICRGAVAIVCNDPQRLVAAKAMAAMTGTALLQNVDPPSVDTFTYLLLYDNSGVSLLQTGRKASGGVRADFVNGSLNHRRRFGGGQGQMIAKAVGIKSGVKPRVLDVTAGLGKDGFILASLGCDVTLLERSPLIHALLEDGLRRARACAELELTAILSRLSLHGVEAKHYLSGLTTSLCPEVIYLDPMFPERTKSARVKKEMQMFQNLLGKDPDAGELLTLALQKARCRVVVKRPRKAQALAGLEPNYALEGKSSRYDIYALARISGR